MIRSARRASLAALIVCAAAGCDEPPPPPVAAPVVPTVAVERPATEAETLRWLLRDRSGEPPPPPDAGRLIYRPDGTFEVVGGLALSSGWYVVRKNRVCRFSDRGQPSQYCDDLTLTPDGPRMQNVDAVMERVPGYVNPPEPPPPPPLSGRVVPDRLTWMREPVARFPEQARARGLTKGVATLTCRPGPDGRLLDCRVLSEAPVRVDFGAEALRAAAGARLSPRSVSRVREGAGVTFSMRFGEE